ncbi:MAG TPA: PspC domain-containing protein, partial [Acidimicrobiales bacterium]|nr:PspC domain-containing protein [Acidimicrobiales bacterium]
HGHHPEGHWARGRWERSRDDRLLGGVAGGISRRLGIDVTVVRIAFAAATVFGGFGAALYLGAWLLLPLDGQDESIGARVAKDRQGIVLALAFVPALVLMLVIGSALHVGVVTSAAWPVFLCAGGGVLLWRNVDSDEREWLRRAARPVVRVGSEAPSSRRLLVLRVVLGAGLVLGGVALLGVHHDHLGVDRVLIGAAFLVAGAVVVFGPWWIHLARDLMAERQARVRAEERADMAARVHDSVLQTLALIQRAADDPHRVVQLARGQERELRAWLFDGEIPAAVGAEVPTLAAGVRAIAAEVEASHGVVVEVVVVGDCPLDERLRALLDAAREATVNSAKWSGAPSISQFAEVEPEKVSVFVRDRGRGFDPDDVAADRRGIAQSIEARMLRHGGRAAIRSAPGHGAEVELSAPRAGSR